MFTCWNLFKQRLYGHLNPQWKFIVPRGRLVGALNELWRSHQVYALDVNNRPLTFVGDEVKDREPLTSVRALIGRSTSFRSYQVLRKWTSSNIFWWSGCLKYCQESATEYKLYKRLSIVPEVLVREDLHDHWVWEVWYFLVGLWLFLQYESTCKVHIPDQFNYLNLKVGNVTIRIIRVVLGLALVTSLHIHIPDKNVAWNACKII